MALTAGALMIFLLTAPSLSAQQQSSSEIGSPSAPTERYLGGSAALTEMPTDRANMSPAEGSLNDGSSAARLIHLTAYAEDQAIVITWETASELSNVGFQVERAVDAVGGGVQWTSVGFAPGQLRRQVPKFYTLLDSGSDPHAAGFLYRLKQTSVNGSILYSKPVRVGAAPQGFIER